MVRFFNTYTYIPSGDYIWNIKLVNGKTVKTAVHKDSILSFQFPLSYRRHSPSFNYVEYLVNKYLPPDVPWIDIGSNMGLRSLLPLSEGRRVYFIEPNCEVNKINLERCILNGYSNFEFFELGVSDKEGFVDFYVDKSSYNSSVEYDITHMEIFNLERKETIKINTIDNIFTNNLGSFSSAYIKIDVEGHELNVIKGASTFLRKIQPTIIIEVNEKGEHFAEFIEIVSGYNYQIFELGDFKRKKYLKRVQKRNDFEYNVNKNDFLVTKDIGLIDFLKPYIYRQ